MTRVRLKKAVDPLQCMRLADVCKLLRVSKHTVRAWSHKAARGESDFPAPICIGDQLRLWPRVEIERWLAKHRRDDHHGEDAR